MVFSLIDTYEEGVDMNVAANGKRSKRATPYRTTVSSFQFISKFPDELTAMKYIENLRWHGKARCPHCGKYHVWIVDDVKRNYWCADCRQYFTVRKGTIFESSHLPLHKWLYAIYLIFTARKGISSVQLAQEIGCTQKTAWYLGHRIREAFSDSIVDHMRNMFRGIVEADECYIGGKAANRHQSEVEAREKAGKPFPDKTTVVGVRERQTGRLRTAVVKNTTSSTLSGIIYENVETGSVVCTDENPAYNAIEGDYIRKTVNHSAKVYVDGLAYTNGIESVWSLVKRGFVGTWHWFSTKHAQRYLDEFAFRLAEGNCQRHSYERLQYAVEMCFGKRLTYRQLKAAA